MIHFTKEGGRKKVGLNLYRARGGFVVAWVWYYPATHELKGGRFRLRMHMKPRILWSVDSCNVIANYLTIHDLQLVNREVLVDLVAGNEGIMTKEEIIEMARQAGFVDYELDDGTTNAFDKRYKAFAKLIAEKAIKEALAQPEQEPVADAYALADKVRQVLDRQSCPDAFMRAAWEAVVNNYTTPPQRKPLSDEFVYWWFEYGSGLFPLEGEDQEEHAYRVATAAWQAAHGIKGD